MAQPTADSLIEALGLIPLPGEGGHFRQTFLADEQVPAEALPARYGRPKALSTAIYYLLSADSDSFSALHRLASDEVYHFYLGDPVEMLLLGPGGGSERVLLGQGLLDGQRVQQVVPRDSWQGSRLVPGGRFALLGTTMAPGYDQRDFELGRRAELVHRYPEAAELIRTLTRG